MLTSLQLEDAKEAGIRGQALNWFKSLTGCPFNVSSNGEEIQKSLNAGSSILLYFVFFKRT